MASLGGLLTGITRRVLKSDNERYGEGDALDAAADVCAVLDLPGGLLLDGRVQSAVRSGHRGDRGDLAGYESRAASVGPGGLAQIHREDDGALGRDHGEAQMPVEAGRPLVGGRDEEVHPHRSLVSQRTDQRVHQLPS